MAAPKILTVEDNPLNAKLIRDVLTLRGYEVIEATRAEEGLELALQHVPDLILMDIHLPGMDGVTALRRLKESEVTRHIPVMAVTASVMPLERRTILAAGFDGYQAKPIRVKEFRAELDRLLAKAGATEGR